MWNNRYNGDFWQGRQISNIVWQYLYTMKLMSILEDDNNQDQSLVDAYSRTKIIFGKLKQEIYGNHRTPDGEYVFHIMSVAQSSSPAMELWGSIELQVTFKPNMDKLTLPLDILSKSIELTMDEIRNKFPELLDESIDVLNKYDLKLFGFHVKPGDSVIGMSEIIGVALYNIKIRGFLEPFGELLMDRSRTELYKFAPIELPEFSKDYKAIHDHVLKNANIIAKVYRKGTWRGHTYDLGKVDDKLNYITLHRDPQHSIIEDGVIVPSLKALVYLRYPKIDGISKYVQGFPLTDDEFKQFVNYVAKLFAKHGVTLM
jgi:hypothetical protein